MPNREEPGKLSPEQVQKLAKTISEAKSLTNQQEEIIQRVLEGETEISNLRISSLEKYFDIYSRNLDLIARKHSALNDAFLILDGKLNNNYEKFSSKFGEIERELADLSNQKDELASNSSANNTESNSTAKAKDETVEVSNIIDELSRLLLDAGTEFTTEFSDLLKAQVTSTKDAIDSKNEARNKRKSTELLISGGSDTERTQMAELKALQANELADASAETKLQAQMSGLLERLNAESMAKKGVLTAEDILANQKTVQDKFGNSEERLAAIRKNDALMADPNTAKLVEANEKKKAAAIAKYEADARRKNNGILTAEREQAIKDLAEKEFELSEENLKKLAEEEEKKNKKQLISADSSLGKIISGIKESENKIVEQDPEASDFEKGMQKTVAALDTAIVGLSNLAAKLDKSIDDIASRQGDIDTRLQGSKNETNYAGSYWGQLTKDMMSVGAVTPFFKQEKFADNIKSLVDQGIAHDLKQRAFLMTIQEKIANTFNVADGTLLRLVRIQQQDTTAGRLGMESALNAFLNNMYENTEYLKSVADGVRSSLQEMEALMGSAEATEVEYQVQKWMGSLYSVGMSQDAVNNIAGALGQLAAGQVDALTGGSGAGNLLVMAANKAGKSISDILTEGLNGEETNALLQATVNYMAELAESSKDSKVIQQQLANVFGVRASDLKAATNLTTDDTIGNISSSYLTYDNMLNRLNVMAGTMGQRTSIGEMMSNVWANGQYSLASSMSNNPAAYLIYKAAGLLDATTGGIPLPDILAAGFGVQLNTTIADLMRVGAMSNGIIGSIGSMISGLSNSFDGQAMLATMGIKEGSGLNVVARGTGDGIGAGEMSSGGGKTTSNSGYVGNSSGSDIKNSTIQEAENSKKQQMIEALEEEQDHQIDFINTNVLKIYELLDEVTSGKRNFNVKVAGYGLTKSGSSGSSSGALGGVAGLSNKSTYGSSALGGGLTHNDSSLGSNGSTSNGSSSSFNNTVNLGGWTVS